MIHSELAEILERRSGARRSVVALGAGDFCEAYLVDDDEVYRVARHDEAADALRREACVLTRIAGAVDVTVPVPIEIEFEERPAYVSHRLVAGADHRLR